MSKELCFRLPRSDFIRMKNFSYYIASDYRRYYVSDLVLGNLMSNGSTNTTLCESWFPHKYDSDMFVFEDTDYNMITAENKSIGSQVMRSTYGNRIRRIEKCKHSYIFI